MMSLERLRIGSRAAGIGAAMASTIVTASFVVAYLTVNPLWTLRRKPPRGARRGFRPVRFPSKDGMMLAGWYADGGTQDTTIVLCHGWLADKTQMVGLTEVLHTAGFNVLMFDFRSWGESERGPVTLGYREALDVVGAVRFLKESHRSQSRRVGVVGVSMGAAATLLAAAEDPDIDAVVADSSYAGLAPQVYRALRIFLGPLTPVFYVFTRWFGEHLMRVPLPTVAPEQAVSRIAPRPVLIIHGMHDRLVDVEDAHARHRSCGGPKALWLVEGADHNQTRAARAEEYDRRVVSFLRQHLIGAGRPPAHDATRSEARSVTPAGETVRAWRRAAATNSR